MGSYSKTSLSSLNQGELWYCRSKIKAICSMVYLKEISIPEIYKLLRSKKCTQITPPPHLLPSPFPSKQSPFPCTSYSHIGYALRKIKYKADHWLPYKLSVYQNPHARIKIIFYFRYLCVVITSACSKEIKFWWRDLVLWIQPPRAPRWSRVKRSSRLIPFVVSNWSLMSSNGVNSRDIYSRLDYIWKVAVPSASLPPQFPSVKSELRIGNFINVVSLQDVSSTYW